MPSTCPGIYEEMLRTSFDFSQVNVHWFPGHMAFGLKAMERRLKKVSCVIEVRDARVPISSANPLLHQVIRKSGARHFVAFNKKVMESLRSQQVYPTALRAASSEDCRRLVSKLIFSMSDICHDPSKPFRIMITGIPNVGKSTLINNLRSISCDTDVKAVRTGAKPGVTRHISEYVKISEDPKVYLMDTPGILVPKIDDPQVGMRLAITGAVMDEQVGEFLLADFLLFSLCAAKNARLLDYMKWPDFNDDINAFLPMYARRMGLLERGAHPNLLNAARSFLARFRKGAFGKITLDPII